MMKRMLLTAAVAVLAANGASREGNASARFDAKLSPDEKIRQALNRLTFGARPGDIEAVRRLGVDKWIELQLHPERIAENPALAARLKPLATIDMETADILTKYFPQFPPGVVPANRVNLNELLPGAQFRKVFNGTAEERRAAIMALDPERRMKVLAMVPPNVVEGLPDLQKEQTAARRKQQEEQQMQMRRMRPPLVELLDAKQIPVALHGTAEQRAALFSSLDADKVQKIAAALPPDALAGQPDLRRLGAMLRQPQQVVIGDLREAKLYRALYSNRQLEEVLADFWFNHFNIFEGKDRVRAMLPSYVPPEPPKLVAPKATILIVEDEDSVRLPLSITLRKAGLTILEASDGHAALDLLRTYAGRIDILLLDITLPGISSRRIFEAARLLRPRPEVIVTSAYGREKAAASPAASVSHFIRKPYRLDDLMNLIRVVLS